MIWRLHEGERLRCGINWRRGRPSRLELMVAWRTVTRFYSIGVRIRRRKSAIEGPLFVWRSLRSNCLFCDVARDITCAKHWKGDPRW